MTRSTSSFSAVPRTRLHTSIVEQILRGVRSGEFPPGSALPAERVLAERLAVSRGSLREAIRVLEHAGVLDVRVGSGTYVADEAHSQATMLRVQAAAMGEHSPLDVIAVRTNLEPLCAELAAASHNPGDLERLEAALAVHTEAVRSGADQTEPDLEFHLAVAAASHNTVLLGLEQHLVELMHEQLWSEMKHRSRSRENAAEEFLEHHRLILEAVRQRDARQAGKMMTMHMSAIEVGLLAELGE